MISNRYILSGLLSLLFLVFSMHMYSQDEKMVFDQGVEKYGSGDYNGAINSWEKLVMSGFISSDLFI